jgi:hypothetical protein
MYLRSIEYAGQFALPLQADIAEQGGRAMRELLQELTYSLFDLGPVLDPAVHLENILAQPPPQLFDWFFILHLQCVGSRKQAMASGHRLTAE